MEPIAIPFICGLPPRNQSGALQAMQTQEERGQARQSPFRPTELSAGCGRPPRPKRTRAADDADGSRGSQTLDDQLAGRGPGAIRRQRLVTAERRVDAKAAVDSHYESMPEAQRSSQFVGVYKAPKGK